MALSCGYPQAPNFSGEGKNVADRERDSETDETIVEHVETAGQTPVPPPAHHLALRG